MAVARKTDSIEEHTTCRKPPGAPLVLVVDDDPGIGSLLREVLNSEGYEVIVATDGKQALERVAERKPDLILLDIDMPRLTGDVVCRRLKQDPVTHLIPVVMITARADLLDRLNAWEYGADEFLSKPFRLIEVTARCRSLLRMKRLIEERDSAEAVVFALARTVEAKSPYTHGHSERVAYYVLTLAEQLNFSEADREILRKGALLHDIGKISIPDEILNKPGRLTDEEYEIIKRHPETGAHIIEPLVSVRDAMPLIRWHHERLDGAGYPDGLYADHIPPLVRALSVADIYDSLSSERPYRPRLDHETCLRMLRESALDGGLDPEMVAAFCDVMSAPVPDERILTTV